ncbi:MAG: hypothetical protein RMJ36_06580 [Candidatus Calescibacterium sp.]|nr:hypothetical protein [Candidatus Calescibacterium sp.]MDW8133301.1 hypothetical protein [Candidatus Calescibacterium sp.]
MKIFALILGILFAIYYIFDEDKFVFIDNANLAIHEFGHLFFSAFGETMGLWGGTLIQIIVPSLILWYFIRNQEIYGIYFSTYWLGQNLLNISRYIYDAQEMNLPLYSPWASDDEEIIHDWNAILSSLGLLKYDDTIGFLVSLLGWGIIVFSMIWLLLNKEDNKQF